MEHRSPTGLTARTEFADGMIEHDGHVGKLLKGHEADGKLFRVHLDGYNQLPYLTGQQERGARQDFFYFNDDGDLVALRYENFKMEKLKHGFGGD